MKKIFFGSVKGGTGKSNTCYQVSAFLSQRGYRVLCVDCDGQNNITKAFLGKAPDVALYDALIDKCSIQDVIYTPYSDIESLANIDIIPSSYNLFNYITGKPTNLLNKLDTISPFYDICLIDTNPSVSAILTNVVVASDYLIGVLDASLDSIDGFEFLKNNIVDEIKETLNPNITILGIVLNNNNRNTQFSIELLRTTKKLYGDLMFNTMITPSTVQKESRAARLPLIEYNPRHQSTLQMNDLTIEIIKRLEMDE